MFVSLLFKSINIYDFFLKQACFELFKSMHNVWCEWHYLLAVETIQEYKVPNIEKKIAN